MKSLGAFAAVVVVFLSALTMSRCVEVMSYRSAKEQVEQDLNALLHAYRRYVDEHGERPGEVGSLAGYLGGTALNFPIGSYVTRVPSRQMEPVVETSLEFRAQTLGMGIAEGGRISR